MIGRRANPIPIPYPSKNEFDRRLFQQFPSYQHKHGDRYYTRDALRAMSFGFDLAAPGRLFSLDHSEIEYQQYLDQNGVDSALVMSLKSIRKERCKTPPQTPNWTKSESGVLLYKGLEVPPAEEMYQEIVSAIRSLPREQRTFQNVRERIRQNNKEIRRDIVLLLFIAPQQSNTVPTAASTESVSSHSDRNSASDATAALVERRGNNQQSLQMMQIGGASVPVNERSINAFMAASAIHYPAHPPNITFVANNNRGETVQNFGPVTHQQPPHQQAPSDSVLASLARLERGQEGLRGGQDVLLSRTVDRRVPSSAVRSSIGRAAREQNGHDLHQMGLFPDSNDSPDGSIDSENNHSDEEDGMPRVFTVTSDSEDEELINHNTDNGGFVDQSTDQATDHIAAGHNAANGGFVDLATDQATDQIAAGHSDANGGSLDHATGDTADEELLVTNQDNVAGLDVKLASGVFLCVETVTSESEEAEDGIEDLDVDLYVETSWSHVPVLPPLEVSLPPAEDGQAAVIQNLLQLVVGGDRAAQLGRAARNAGYGINLNSVFLPWKEALANAAWGQALATQLATSPPQYPHSVPSRSVQDVARRFAVSTVIPLKLGMRLSLDAEVAKLQNKIAKLQHKIQAAESTAQDIAHRDVVDLENLKMQLDHLRFDQSDAEATTPAVAEMLKKQFAKADSAHKKLKRLYDFLREAEDPDFISDLLGEFVQAIVTLTAVDAMTWQGLQGFLDGNDPVIAFLGASNDIAIYCSDALLDGNIEGLLFPLVGFFDQVCIEVDGASVTVAWMPTEEAFHVASQVVESILRTALAHATLEEGRQARGRGRHRQSLVQISCETKANKKGVVPLSAQQLGSLAFKGNLSFRSSTFSIEQQGILDEQGVVQHRVGLAFAASSITLENCHMDEGGSRLANLLCGETFVEDLIIKERCCLAEPALLHLINNLSDAGSATVVHFLGGALADFIQSEQAMQEFIDLSIMGIKVCVSRLRCFVMDAEHSASIESRLSTALMSMLKSKPSFHAFNRSKELLLELTEDDIPFCLTGGAQQLEWFVASLHGRIKVIGFEEIAAKSTTEQGFEGPADATVTNEGSEGFTDPSNTKLESRSDEKENENEKGTEDASGKAFDPHNTPRADETKKETGNDVKMGATLSAKTDANNLETAPPKQPPATSNDKTGATLPVKTGANNLETAPPKQPPATSNVKTGATLDSQQSDDFTLDSQQSDDVVVEQSAAVETARAPTYEDYGYVWHYSDFRPFEQLPVVQGARVPGTNYLRDANCNFLRDLERAVTIPQEKIVLLHQALQLCTNAHKILQEIGSRSIVARTTPNCCLQVLPPRNPTQPQHPVFVHAEFMLYFAHFDERFLVTAKFGTTLDEQYDFLVSATTPEEASSTLGMVLQIVARTEDVQSYDLEAPPYDDGTYGDLPLEDDKIEQFLLAASLHSKPKLRVGGFALNESQERLFKDWGVDFTSWCDGEDSDSEEDSISSTHRDNTSKAEDSKPASVHHLQKDNNSQLSALVGNRMIRVTLVSLGVDEDEDTIFDSEPHQPSFAGGAGSSNIQPCGAAASLGMAEQDSLLANEDVIPEKHQPISLQHPHQNGVPSAVGGNNAAEVEIIDLMESDDEVSQPDEEDSVPVEGGSVPVEPVLVSENGERTIELLPGGTILRFKKYQTDTFELLVGTERTLQHSTVVLLRTGHLRYTSHDGEKKLAKVPLGAKPEKFWCDRCGGRGRCGTHKLSDD